MGAPREVPADTASSVTQGNAIESEHLSELTEEEYEAHYIRKQDLKGFMWLDAKYLNPFFTRRLTQEVGMSRIPCLPSSGLQWPRLRRKPLLELVSSQLYPCCFLPCTPWKMANNSLGFPTALRNVGQPLMLSQEVSDRPVALALLALQLSPPGVGALLAVLPLPTTSSHPTPPPRPCPPTAKQQNMLPHF